MLEALKWVNANIEEFGGDTSRIVLQGESVGSASVSALCISPLAKGLFSRAIMQSESVLFYTSGILKPNMELGQELAEAVGCASEDLTIWQNPTSIIDCLRGINATHLVRALYSLKPATSLTFHPIYGDEFLPRNPALEFNAGNFRDVPLLIGNVPEEGSFILATTNPYIFGFFGEKDTYINKTMGEHILKQTFKRYPDVDSLVHYYLGDVPDDDYEGIRRQAFTAEGNIYMTCVSVYFAEKYAAFSNNVYYYMFKHRPSTSPWAPWMGRVHFEDVEFAFGFPLRQPWRYEDAEVQLSAEIVEIWSHFAKHG